MTLKRTLEELRASLAPSEQLIWAGRPVSRIPRRMLLIAAVLVIAVFYTTYVEGHVLLFGAFPSMEQHKLIIVSLAISVVATVIAIVFWPHRAAVKGSGDQYYAVTNNRVFILRTQGIESFDEDLFRRLGSMRVGTAGDVLIDFRGDGNASGPSATLYGVADPFRVACLIRATLAPHTLAKNIKGNLA
jgi:hypothetical protein